MRRVRILLRNLFRGEGVERHLDDEMRATLEALADEKRRAGMDASLARRAAAIELGVESIKVQVREARGGAAIERFARDVRHALRLLRRNPLFAATAALSLAIGIGAVTAVFTLGEELLRFAPEAVTDPGRLVEIGRRFEGLSFGFNPTSYPDYLDIRQRITTIEHVYAHPLFPQTLTVTAGSDVEQAVADIVTMNYFAALGTGAAIGRVFSPDESDQPGASPVVVLSHRFWMRRFGGDPGIVGKSMRLNRYPVTVIGVAPEGFHGTTIAAIDLWAPLSVATFVTPVTQAQMNTRRASWLVIGGRLAPQASLEQAGQDLAAIDRALRVEYPQDEQNLRSLRVQAASSVAGNGPVAAAAVVLLGGITSIVLLIACANVAGLLLARAAGRRREMALRLAIGAARSRLVQQLLIETAVLFALGAAGGCVLAQIMTSTLLSVLPSLRVPVSISASVDWRAFAFGIGLSLVAALLSGLAPAFHAARTDVATVLKDESQGPRLRLRSAFVVAQVALSLLLVVVGTLFLRALQVTRASDGGFDPRDVHVASLDLATGEQGSAAGMSAGRDLLERVRSLPEVSAASLAFVLPLATETMGVTLAVPGDVPQPGDLRTPIIGSGNIVTPGYFAAMRIPLLAGRDFTDRDTDGAPRVAIVGEAAARRFWPGRNPIGEQLAVGAASTSERVQIVGVARDLQYSSIDSGPVPFVYLPWRQHYMAGMTLVVRPRDERATDRLRAVVTTFDAASRTSTIRPLGDVIAANLLPQRLGATIAGGLGLVGIWLAAMGVYGVTAHTVARRTREIAIRSALGASRRAVMLLALEQAFVLAGVGSSIGLTLAVIAGQVLSMLLLGVSPFDPVALSAALLLCGGVVLAACAVPIHRAMRIPAGDALRAE